MQPRRLRKALQAAAAVAKATEKTEPTAIEPVAANNDLIPSNPLLAENPLLIIALEAAVPLWIHKMRDWPFDRIQARAQELGGVIASTSDNVLYKSKKAGKTAEAFNALAEGLACLAFVPGGVRAFGLHFEAKR